MASGATTEHPESKVFLGASPSRYSGFAVQSANETANLVHLKFSYFLALSH